MEINEHSVFSGHNDCEEHFFAIHGEYSSDFRAEAQALWQKYQQLLQSTDCSEQSEVLLRFHLSDINCQQDFLADIIGPRNSFISLVGQAPANGCRIAIESWHIKSPNAKKFVSKDKHQQKVDLFLENYNLLFNNYKHANVCNSYQQSEIAFNNLVDLLETKNGNLLDNCLRTWIYCRDVDNNYAGMVEHRNKLFEKHGLTPNSRFIASTGIEGQNQICSQLIGMDSYSLFGLEYKQMRQMHAHDYISPTHIYNVAFERGTQVVFGDRSHYFISGTASIDDKGEIVHQHDVIKQCQRTVFNIKMLMQNHHGDLEDLKLLTVYLRDRADYKIVAAELEKIIPNTLPRVIVQAPVCRPDWLIEMEAIGVNNFGDKKYKNFQ